MPKCILICKCVFYTKHTCAKVTHYQCSMHFGIATYDMYSYASIRKMNQGMLFFFIIIHECLYSKYSSLKIKRHGESNTGHITLVIYITMQAIPVSVVDIRIDKPLHKKGLLLSQEDKIKSNKNGSNYHDFVGEIGSFIRANVV